MRQVVFFITFAYFCAHAIGQEENVDIKGVKTSENEQIRPSMLSMLSKYVEMNGTIDQVTKGSMTESYGGVWLNATQRPSGLCEIEETYEEEITIIERKPFEVEVEVWCWTIRCTETETRYREEKITQNVTKTRILPQCCENYEMDPETNECRPICVAPCENYGSCVAPNTCKCDYGFEGKYCDIDSLPEGILDGPNVCEREEMREEVVRVTENELMETTVKEWCWPKIRCTSSKMEMKPVEKMQKIVKPHRVRYCCDGYAQNFMGNRCFAVEKHEDSQQQIIQNQEY